VKAEFYPWKCTQGRHAPLSVEDGGALRHLRMIRESPREWGENAIGIDGPIVTPTAPWFVKMARWLLGVEP
jgi:hypothetical protein